MALASLSVQIFHKNLFSILESLKPVIQETPQECCVWLPRLAAAAANPTGGRLFSPAIDCDPSCESRTAVLRRPAYKFHRTERQSRGWLVLSSHKPSLAGTRRECWTGDLCQNIFIGTNSMQNYRPLHLNHCSPSQEYFPKIRRLVAALHSPAVSNY